ALSILSLSLTHARTQRKKLEDMSDGSYPEHQTQEEKWVEKYEQLKDFRDRFGHCRVPKMWDENLALGTWVYVLLVCHVSCACAALPLTPVVQTCDAAVQEKGEAVGGAHTKAGGPRLHVANPLGR